MDLRQIPRAVDGTPFNAPCMFVSGLYLYIAGAGDDVSEGRGNGQEFYTSRNDAGETDVDWQFNDLVYMAGGGASFLGAELGDWASLWIVAPATAIIPNGSNEGNCNLVSPPGIVVPAAGDGAYDVDLDTAVLVPAIQLDGSYNGYWDWDFPIVGRGTITPSTTPGTAKFHLVPAEVPLVRYACKLPLLGGGDLNLTLPAVEPKAQLPHWKGRLKLHNHGGNHEIKCSWYLMMGRAVTL